VTARTLGCDCRYPIPPPGIPPNRMRKRAQPMPTKFPAQNFHVRIRGRYWGQSGHALLHRICPLMTQSGHPSRSQRDQPRGMLRPKDLAVLNRSRHSQIRRLRHKNRVGQRIVRHICAEGLLSRPRPSFGCLKFRPMMSTKSSRLTLAFGSNE